MLLLLLCFRSSYIRARVDIRVFLHESPHNARMSRIRGAHEGIDALGCGEVHVRVPLLLEEEVDQLGVALTAAEHERRPAEGVLDVDARVERQEVATEIDVIVMTRDHECGRAGLHQQRHKRGAVQ